jgi:filamentous hemagglutinin family protein
MQWLNLGHLGWKLKATIALLLIGFVSSNGKVQAQVVSDGTTNTQVEITGDVFTITGKTKAGTNLFHSFERFSLPANTTANFANLAEITHIFSRVTGGSVSEIDGLIKASGNASLFFLNPAGIVFGANAQLDLGGSFIASTGESIIFADGTEFEAIKAENEPLLTVTAPVGLQYGTASGSITIQENNNRGASNLPVGLNIKPGNTLALLGNNIFIQRNDLNAFGSNVELGGVSLGIVELQSGDRGWQFDYDNITEFSPINLAQTRIISNGIINLRGKEINLTQGSGINNFTQSDGQGGIINLQSSDRISLNTSSLFTQVGQLRGDLEQIIAGKGGNILIKAPQIEFSNGSFVSAGTLSKGAGGDITIDATESIKLLGGNVNPSLISTSTQGSGDGGQLNINTQELIIQDGSQIQALGGEGAGGTITVNATESIRLAGKGTVISRNREGVVAQSTSNSGLSASSGIEGLPLALQPQGKSGNLIITTPKLNIDKEAQISVSNFGTADAGSIEINTNDLNLNTRGQIVANTASGKGGGINLNVARSAILQNGAAISTTAAQNGDGGNISITTDNLVLLNSNRISANAQNGDGGNIQIQARGFFLDADSKITASSDFGIDGVVDIITLDLNSRIETKEPEPSPLAAENYITTGCSVGQDFTANKFRYIGRGGLPPNIMERTVVNETFADLGDSNIFTQDTSHKIPSHSLDDSTPGHPAIAEATTWKINEKGNIELIAQTANSLPKSQLACQN